MAQTNCGLIRKFEIGINIEKLQKELKRFLPKIEEIGWWEADGQGTHQGQFAIHGKVGSNNPYHQSCGPQPDLSKDISDSSIYLLRIDIVSSDSKGSKSSD